jgi:ferrous iron transport protein B
MNNLQEQAKYIASLVMKKGHSKLQKQTDAIDHWVMHPVLGFLLFALLMMVVFTVSQTFLGPWLADIMMMGFDNLSSYLETWMISLNTSDFIMGLMLEGVIGGFAAVIGFLPLIMVLFFLLQLMEDSGYMSRVAVLMDRHFKKIGLAGKSIIPLYVGTACSIPAIMATRTIKNERQRKLTILLTPFVPCGAKLPVIALLITVFFGGSGFMTGLTYFLAIVVIFLAGFIMRLMMKTPKMTQFDEMSFVELPNYQRPSLKQAFQAMMNQAFDFIKKAGTIIVLMNGMVWLLTNFNFSLELVSHPNDSMLRVLSEPIAWLLTPIGIGVWGFAAATLLGFIAKEEVVGALAVIFALSVGDDFGIQNIEATQEVLMAGGLTIVSAYAFMAFNLFTPPCFAAIGAMNTELKSKKWTLLAVFYQLWIGYLVAMIIYQIGTLIVTGTLGTAWFSSLVVLGLSMSLILWIRGHQSLEVSHG